MALTRKPQPGASRGGKNTAKKMNPFDMKVTKPKFDVLNRDKLGIRGAPAQSKMKNRAIREATLLPEIQQRGKASSFVDRRFGEREKNLTEEEKMLERFSRVRQTEASKKTAPAGRKAKRSIFNLDMEDEYGDDSLVGLTHMGENVSDIEEFSDPEEGAFAHEKGLIDASKVRRGYFGGFGNEAEEEEEHEVKPEEKKSKSEVMREVIAKSKFYKAERQKLKEENIELCEDLDATFSTSLRPVLQSLRSDRAKEVREEDDYDVALKQMLFDVRAKPTDRLMTEDEAKKRREQALEAREARMAGRREDNDSDDEDAKEAQEKKPIVMDTEKDEQRALSVLDEFCEATTKEGLAEPFARLLQMSQGPASVALGRAIRTKLSGLLSKFMSSQQRPFFPARSTLLLFHLIGRLYSTSDMHHVIVTPAQVLAAGWLTGGRMTRPKHVISAIFLSQTLLSYQKDSKRLLPEVFNLLPMLLSYFFPKEQADLCYDSGFNKVILDRIQASMPSGTVEPKALTFEDLTEEREFSPELTSKLLAALLHLARTIITLYSDLPSITELMDPIAQRLAETPYSIKTAAGSSRSHLALQHHKPMALPMLSPDLEGEDKASRDTSRLKAAYKRELKGAKREIRRDNEFLARHAAVERKRKDAEYKQMINRVYGTIANDGANVGSASHKSKKPRST